MTRSVLAAFGLAALVVVQERPVPVPPTHFAPLILDVDGNGLQLVSAQDGVDFDLEADEHPRRIGWTKAGADDVFLAEDVTENGRIETGVELLSGQSAGANGFESLRRFDRNGDAVLDVRDPPFTDRLILWRDTNHNGLSESDELFMPASLGVVSFTLAYTVEKSRDALGNQIVLSAGARVRNSAGVSVARDVYAVALDVSR
jgi:hypothetical protein